MESQSVVRLVASLWLGGNASTVFLALVVSSWLGAGAALATASCVGACCVLKSGARHMLALRGEASLVAAATSWQYDRLRLYHLSAISMSFPLAWEAAVLCQLRIIPR